MLTFRFSVVHCLPSAIRLEEWTAPDSWKLFVDRSAKHAALADATAILNKTATTRLPDTHLRDTANKVTPAVLATYECRLEGGQAGACVQVDANLRRDLFSVEEIFLSQPDA